MTSDLLIEKMIDSGVLKTPRIIEAFRHIDRKIFVPPELKDRAYIDEPLPLGFGSTISQPSTVAFMLELLAPSPGDHILDIGSGSGWQTALLAQIVSSDEYGRPLPKEGAGFVVGLEHIPELAKESMVRLHRFSFTARGIAEVHTANGEYGYPKKAPYHAIIVAAGVREVMPAWKESLSPNGRLVFPKKWSIVRMEKKGDGVFIEEQYDGYIFVPFVRESDYDPYETD